MMKKIVFSAITLSLVACGSQSPQSMADKAITDQVQFCESVCFKGDTLLIANFGGTELNPLNQDGKGYILANVNGKNQMYISPTGLLNAPKGMLVHNGYLYVADVNQIVVFDLSQTEPAGRAIPMPTDELFVNDIAIDPSGERLFITVTNTGNIYTLNTLQPDSLSKEDVSFYTNVEGANGIAIDSDKMYVASYPADGKTKASNTIYIIENMAKPEPKPLIERPGQYDGLVVDGGILFFTNWENSEVGEINLADNEVELLNLTKKPVGPARIVVKNGKIFVPDLPGSQVIEHQL